MGVCGGLVNAVACAGLPGVGWMCIGPKQLLHGHVESVCEHEAATERAETISCEHLFDLTLPHTRSLCELSDVQSAQITKRGESPP